jgi:hypothetical protein
MLGRRTISRAALACIVLVVACDTVTVFPDVVLLKECSCPILLWWPVHLMPETMLHLPGHERYLLLELPLQRSLVLT